MAKLYALILTLAWLARICQGAATCYLMTGDVNPSKQVAPCNASVTGTNGSHSACCNAANSDICVSSGLCVNTEANFPSHLLWASGCTDPTMNDPSCPQVCKGSKYGTLGNYGLRSCGSDQNNTWCCGYDGQNITDCCKNTFQMPMRIGQFIRQLSPSATAAESTNSPTNSPSPSACSSSTPTTCPEHSDTNFVAGIAVTSILAGLATIGLVAASVYIMNLKRRNHDLIVQQQASFDEYQQRSPTATTTQPPPPHQTYSPATAVNTPVTASNTPLYAGYAGGEEMSPELGGTSVNELHAGDSRPAVPELPEKTGDDFRKW